MPKAGASTALAPDAVEFVADTGTLLTLCSCSAPWSSASPGRTFPRR